MNPIDRRAFLAGSLAAPFVIGRISGRPHPRSDHRVDPWAAPLAAMAQTHRGAVVLLVPSDPGPRRLLGEALFDWAHGTPFYDWEASERGSYAQRQEHFRRSIQLLEAATFLICATEDAISARFPDRAPAGLTLLDAKGAALDRGPAAPVTTPEHLPSALLEFVIGPDRSHLKRIAGDALRALTPDQQARFTADLATAQLGQPDLAVLERLQQHRALVGPCITLAYVESSTPAGCAALSSLLPDSRSDASQKPLPFGTLLPSFREQGCDHYAEGVGPLAAVDCGMAMPRPGSRRFLRFLK